MDEAKIRQKTVEITKIDVALANSLTRAKPLGDNLLMMRHARNLKLPVAKPGPRKPAPKAEAKAVPAPKGEAKAAAKAKAKAKAKGKAKAKAGVKRKASEVAEAES